MSTPSTPRGGRPGPGGRPRRGRGVSVGLASWTDPGLVAAGLVPKGATTAEERLRAYAQRFRVVGVDDAFSIPPTEREVGQWVHATPDGFRFDVTAHRLLSLHPVAPDTLGPEIRDGLAPEVRARRTVYADDLGPALLDAALDRFLATLTPLHEFGRLGAVVFRFPAHFQPSPTARDHLLWIRDRARDLPVAVELGHRSWLESKHREDTLAFFEEHGLIYVCVDEPQGLASSLPPVAAATARSLAIVRFQGRNLDAWERAGVAEDERRRYDYRPGDLEPWVARLERLAEGGRPVHAIMATTGRDNSLRAARLLIRQLSGKDEPRVEERPPRGGAQRRRGPGRPPRPGGPRRGPGR